MTNFLSESAQFQRVSNEVAAGTTLITSDEFSMVGFDRVLVLVILGAVVTDAATITATLQVENSSGSFVNTLAKVVHVTSTSANKILVLDVARPISLGDGGAKITVARADQTVEVDAILVAPYNAAVQPIDQNADVAAIARFTKASDAS